MQIFFVEGDNGLPPTEENWVVLKTNAGGLKDMRWWDQHVDHAVVPLLFPREMDIWIPGLELGSPDQPDPFYQNNINDQNVEDAVLDDSSEIAEEDRWDFNPYADEEVDPMLGLDEDDYGEGEQFDVDGGTDKRHVSRSQAARYMMQIRAPPRQPGNVRRNPWHDPHWLWWARRLAEYYCCLLINKIEREKFAEIKKRQKSMRSDFPEAMVQELQRRADQMRGITWR